MNRLGVLLLSVLLCCQQIASAATGLVPLDKEAYSALFFREYFQALKSHGDRREAISFVRSEILRQREKEYFANMVNLEIILGQLMRSVSSADAYLQLQDAVSEAEIHQLSYELALAHFEIGDLYSSMGLQEDAMKHLFLTRDIAKVNSYSELALRALYQAATLHYSSDNFEEAILSLQTAVNAFSLEDWLEKDHFTVTNLISAYNTMGLSYLALEKQNEALEAYEKALQVAKGSSNDLWVGLLHGNIGNIFLKQSKLDTAEVLMNFDLVVSKRYHDYASIATDYLLLAQIYQERGNFAIATRYYDSAGYLIREKGLQHPGYFRMMADLAYEMGDFKTAVDLKNIFYSQTDSLDKIKKSKELALVQANFDFRSKLEALELLEKENQLKDEELKYKNVLIYGGAFVTMLTISLLFVVVRSNRLKIKLNKELEWQVEKRTRKLASTIKELDTFIYRLSHDFRRPLTTLLGLDSLGQVVNKDPETAELFAKVGKTARQMDRMLLKMTYINEINRLKPEMEDIKLRDAVQKVLDGFGDDVLSSKFQVTIAIPPDTIVRTDAKFLQLILANLIENAIVFASDSQAEKLINISFIALDDSWEIEISDNGEGISPEVRKRIYEPFFRGSPTSQGNGLGLYLVKKAVDKLKGKVVDFTNSSGECVFKIKFFKQK